MKMWGGGAIFLLSSVHNNYTNMKKKRILKQKIDFDGMLSSILTTAHLLLAAELRLYLFWRYQILSYLSLIRRK